MSMADEITCRAEKVTKRGGGTTGKESPPPPLLDRKQQQHLHDGNPPFLPLPVGTHDVQKGGDSTSYVRPLRGYENLMPRRSVVAIITLVAVFALSGSIIVARSLGVPVVEQQRVAAAAYIPYPKIGYPFQVSRIAAADEEEDPAEQRSNFDEILTHSDGMRSGMDEPLNYAPPPGCDPLTAKLKVFMYDLPPEFHYGMIAKEKFPAGKVWPKDSSDIPEYPGGLYQQHSPEYWLTSDLFTSNLPGRHTPCTAFRVDDWRTADVIFVPFFASLSYNKFSKPELNSEENEELQRKLEHYLKRQPAWQTSGGVDHVIVIHHPNSMHIMRDALHSAMFVVADFGRYTPEIANITKDVVAPYKHVVLSYQDDHSTFNNRNTLLFFQGAIIRKQGGIIRQQLYELLKEEPGVHFESGNTQSDGIQSATKGMQSSKFCLHLAGDTPSSNRLFDAIASHCVPVVISDEIELPYEDVLDYTEFCIFVKSENALQKGFVVKLLRSIKSEEWVKMWKRLKQVELHFRYQHPSEPDDAVNMVWKAIARKVPPLKFSLNKQSRYKRSEQSSPTDH